MLIRPSPILFRHTRPGFPMSNRGRWLLRSLADGYQRTRPRFKSYFNPILFPFLPVEIEKDFFCIFPYLPGYYLFLVLADTYFLNQDIPVQFNGYGPPAKGIYARVTYRIFITALSQHSFKTSLIEPVFIPPLFLHRDKINPGTERKNPPEKTLLLWQNLRTPPDLS